MAEQKKQKSKKVNYPPSRINGLKHYPKGKTGNPNGKPKGAKDGLRAHALRLYKKTLPKAVKDQIKSKGFNITSKTYAGAIVEIIAISALLGDINAAKCLFNLTEAPLPRALQITDADGDALDAKIILEVVKPPEEDDERCERTVM